MGFKGSSSKADQQTSNVDNKRSTSGASVATGDYSVVTYSSQSSDPATVQAALDANTTSNKAAVAMLDSTTTKAYQASNKAMDTVTSTTNKAYDAVTSTTNKAYDTTAKAISDALDVVNRNSSAAISNSSDIAKNAMATQQYTTDAILKSTENNILSFTTALKDLKDGGNSSATSAATGIAAVAVVGAIILATSK